MALGLLKRQSQCSHLRNKIRQLLVYPAPVVGRLRVRVALRRRIQPKLDPVMEDQHAPVLSFHMLEQVLEVLLTILGLHKGIGGMWLV
jgi:hypothetical protein